MICYNKAGKYQEDLGKGEEEASEHERDDSKNRDNVKDRIGCHLTIDHLAVESVKPVSGSGGGGLEPLCILDRKGIPGGRRRPDPRRVLLPFPGPQGRR